MELKQIKLFLSLIMRLHGWHACFFMVSKKRNMLLDKAHSGPERTIAMKQKYLILNDKENKQIKIQEFAELNKEMLSLLCEEAYDYKSIKSAISAGKDELIATLRTNNLYPPGIYAVQIADAVIDLTKSKKQESVELFFDDKNLLTKTRKPIKIIEQVEDEPDDPDDMLEVDFDESYIEKDEIKKIDSSLKIADDNYVDDDDGS